jgi:hypothetical protein
MLKMKYKKIKIEKIVEGHTTYPSWSTGTCYPLKYKSHGKNQVIVFYNIKTNKIISKVFPKTIDLSPQFTLVLGIIKGEGANSLGKSNYRRFTFTNSDPDLFKRVLSLLDKNHLVYIKRLPDGCLHILHHTSSNDAAILFWSTKLNLPERKFRCFNDKTLSSKYGVCHLYLSDVLLRRVADLLIDSILKKGC